MSAVASRNRSWFDPVIADYIDAHTAQPDDIQRDLIEETRSVTGSSAGMQIGSDQGSLMALLVRLTGARRMSSRTGVGFSLERLPTASFGHQAENEEVMPCRAE